MDQGPLVSEQIDAGKSLIDSFTKQFPVSAAFWLKESEVGQWYLYLVSDQISDRVRPAYSEVIRILTNRPRLWLDPMQVKVTGVDNPVAAEVREIQRNFPISVGTKLRNRPLGGLMVEEMYIYPLPVAFAAT